METISVETIQKRINLLMDLNIGAKNLVKRGEFRLLSEKLEEIIDNPKINIFFEKNFRLYGENYEKLERNDKLRLEYEILRYKVFVFQHLAYYDALTQKKTISLDVSVNIMEDEKKDLQKLFDRLNKFNGKDKINTDPIVTKDSIEKEARLAYDEICRNVDTKISWESKDEIEKKVWQEKVWLVLCYINEQFHLDKFDECLTKLEKIKHFIFEKISDEETTSKNNPFFCFTTKATILSLMANCQSMKGQLREAEANYYEAIRLYTCKAKNPKDTNGENKEVRLHNNIKFQFRRTAQIFIYGMLRVNAKKSNIDRCKANLLITELLLTEQKEDETTWLALEFSKLVIKRIEAGFNIILLKDIRKQLLFVKAKVELLSHRPLLAEVNFELAIINHLLKNWDIAESLLKEVEEYYDEDLYRMKANICILLSHINRSKGNFPKSIEFAKEGIRLSKMSNNIIAKMDAAICLAETCFEYNKLGNEIVYDAYKFFERALALNEQMQSPKIEAICFLGLCKVSAFRKDKDLAELFWDKYLMIKQFCQHKFIFDILEHKGKLELDSLNDNNLFIINSQSDELNYDKNIEKLKLWSFSKAMENSLTDTDIAEKLGISRQSVITWKKSFGLDKKKR